MSRPASVLDLVQSHRITAVIYAAAKLSLAEAVGDEAKSVAELARLVSADERALRRLLVGLTTLGLCRQADHDRFAMTDLGLQLGETADPSFKDWVLFEGEMLAQSWSGLVDSVRTGKTATQLRGEGDDRYAATGNTPESNRRFNAAMVSLTRSIVPKIVTAHEFAAARLVMDIGGGTGELIGAIVQHNPHLEGIVFDLARCETDARTHFDRLGIAGRSRFVTGSFFEDIPSGADTIVMKSILHNWNDDRCRIILRNCRNALPSDGTLIVIERIMPERATTAPEDRSCVMSDLNMLRGPGGCERTEAEYRKLADSAGFAFVRTTGIGSFSLVQFRKSGH
ncbi:MULTISPECIES: methyltransferase [Bradyrhizobium]|uniref:Methyltransferase n=1 Tax=Bradyrhizobium canariense TaxID=255045 RepID=A0A1X3FEB0_9BRAD|nr:MULTISPECIES: methyltransferase [Bradyrhizobium]OSI64814.1 methyltransferase [Bradyrhizobium canariense]OSI74287.1 methyltransferase [Bradyrhizobium canariense]OSI84647.1 methyltransferase [Bradyrhizobium canariense]OSI92231.1 methyltransferase [Bradyrhizobium canariense]OSJ00138.1 methyltransferase [Bradyrhizobium canariense]